MATHKSPHEERFRKLARRIEELRRKDEEVQTFRTKVRASRQEALQRLWGTCRSFADALNAYVNHDRLELTPPDPPDELPDEDPIQLMLNVRGRVLLLDLRAPENLIASDNFKKPYILEGDVRFFNQELLESDRVEEHGIFFCPGEGERGAWLFWNMRSYKSGVVDEGYLASLLEHIL